MLQSDAPPPPEKLRIGQCTVDVSSREVQAPGARRPLRITPKAMGVLLALVESADKVVSRDALLAAVWPDTMPSDDVLTQAVTQLRKAFQEVRGDPQYIETIAKGGYRLLADVENLDEAAPVGVAPVSTVPSMAPDGVGQVGPSSVASPAESHSAAVDDGSAPGTEATSTFPSDSGPTTAETPARRPNWQVLGFVLVQVLLVIGLVWWLGYRGVPDTPAPASGDVFEQSARPPIKPFLITSAPGFELAPTLSPGGGLVAYMAVPEGQRNIALMLQTTAPVAPRQLTYPEGMAEDAMPEWSPDGRDIAFVRMTAGRDCHLMVVRATGRAERTVGTCDPGNQPLYSWTPDGEGLILDRGAEPGLQVLDLESGRTTAVEYDDDPDHLDVAPRYSPDGRWIGFLRNLPLGDFWRIPAGGGTAERLTRMGAEVRGWDWTPDSRALVYARRNDGVSRLYRFDIASGKHLDLGVENGEQPAMARNVAALAYVLRYPRFGLYRFDATGNRQGGRLFASSGRDQAPSIAPDGRQLVFVSDRSGPFGLWWGDVDVPGSLRLLEGVQPDSRQPAGWSSDSRRLLVIGSPDSGRSDARVNGVFEVVPDSGRITRLPLSVTDPVQAVYAPGPTGPDQRLLVLFDRGDGRLRLSLFADDEHPDEALASLDDVTRIQVDAPRGRVLFSRLADPGLWQVDLDLDPASIRPVALDGGFARWHHAWSVGEDGGTYLVRRTPGCPALLTHDRGGSSSAAEDDGAGALPVCLDAARRAATRAFSFNPRTRQLYITLAEYDGGDIGFAVLGSAEAKVKAGSVSH